MDWDKTSSISFFRTHIGRLVLIKEQKSRVLFRGKVTDVVEMDLCSSILVEATLQLKTTGPSVALTFHDGFLGAHLMITPSDSSDPEVSIPYQIRYEDLVVENQ